MDNKIFNVNGISKEQLENALKSLLLDDYGNYKKVKAWYYSKESGFVLCWGQKDDDKKYKLFTDRMGNSKPIEIGELIEILWEWLYSDEAKTVKLNEFEEKLNDFDVEEKFGWRLYTDDWGHIYNSDGYTIDNYSIAAFKPMWLYYGK